jgi:RNA polymerase sigma-70 factor (ECF subfamily)
MMAEDALRALQAGDPAALAALFDTHADRLYRLALGLLRDPAQAEDVVQETFLAAITHLDRFEGRSSVGTWLYRIAYNASLGRLRRRAEDPLPAEEPEIDQDAGPPLPKAFVDWDFSPEQILADGEARQQVDRAIEALPESLRAAFILRDIEGLSTAEAGEILGLSEGAVKVRLHRARLALRERLSRYFAERIPPKEEAP